MCHSYAFILKVLVESGEQYLQGACGVTMMVLSVTMVMNSVRFPGGGRRTHPGKRGVTQIDGVQNDPSDGQDGSTYVHGYSETQLARTQIHQPSPTNQLELFCHSVSYY